MSDLVPVPVPCGEPEMRIWREGVLIPHRARLSGCWPETPSGPSASAYTVGKTRPPFLPSFLLVPAKRQPGGLEQS